MTASRLQSAKIALAISTALFVPSRALAEPAERVGVYVLPVSTAPADPGEVEAAVVGAGAAAGDDVVPDVFAVARAPDDAPRRMPGWLRDLARARQLAAEGWRAYLGVDSERALDLLEDARALAAQVLALPGAPAVLADVLLRTGAVELSVGRQSEALRAFRLARELSPKLDVTESRFAPEVVEAYHGAEPPGEARDVILSADAPGASFEINGEVLGDEDSGGEPSTEARTTLAPGVHAVVARAPGRIFASRLFEVEEGEGGGAKGIHLELEPDDDVEILAAGEAALASGAGGDAVGAGLGRAIARADLDAVVLVASAWRRGEPVVLGQRCEGDPARCSLPVEIGYRESRNLGAGVRRLWATVRGASADGQATLDADSRVRDPEPAPAGLDAPEQAADASGTWWRSAWVWGGAGAAAAALGAAALFWPAGGGDAEVSIPPCEFGGC